MGFIFGHHIGHHWGIFRAPYFLLSFFGHHTRLHNGLHWLTGGEQDSIPGIIHTGPSRGATVSTAIALCLVALSSIPMMTAVHSSVLT